MKAEEWRNQFGLTVVAEAVIADLEAAGAREAELLRDAATIREERTLELRVSRARAEAAERRAKALEAEVERLREIIRELRDALAFHTRGKRAELLSRADAALARQAGGREEESREANA